MSSTNFETSNRPPLQPVHPDDILSPWNREILTPNAVRVYEAIWFVMRNRGSAAIWLSDEDLSRRSRLLIQYVPGARAELMNAQLLNVEQGSSRMEWLYTYVEQEHPEDADDSHAQDLGAGQ